LLSADRRTRFAFGPAAAGAAQGIPAAAAPGTSTEGIEACAACLLFLLVFFNFQIKLCFVNSRLLLLRRLGAGAAGPSVQDLLNRSRSNRREPVAV